MAAKHSLAESAIAPKDSVVKLFNGKDLQGLTTWLSDTKHDDPRGVFSVKDGVLHISGNGIGYVRTNDEYENYRLIVEYRWSGRTLGQRKENARDSGVLIHAVGPDGNANGMWMSSIEAQIIEGGTGDFIAIAGHDDQGRPVATKLTAEVENRGGHHPVWKRGGETITIPPRHVDWSGKSPAWKDQRGFRGHNDVERPLGQWNRMEIKAHGKRVTVKLNGVTVNQALATFPNKGRILIQSELAEIEVRKWELTPIATR